MHYNRIQIILLSLFLMFFLGCESYSDKFVWSVILSTVPRKISVDDARFNYVYYILKQTHEPLFRKDDGENFTSRVLKNWSRSIDYREYNFCPDTSLNFNKKIRFNEELELSNTR